MTQPGRRYFDIISGKRRGIWATCIRFALRFASAFYRVVIGSRNWYYSFFSASRHRVSRPVISIGNITTGGTGKTPMAAKLAHVLLAKGRRVAILSRGYRGASIEFDEEGRERAAADWSAASDEAWVLKRRCPRAVVYLDSDRVASARRAVDEGCDCLLLDDGFQHRRLSRDLDIVLVDATDPFGWGFLLPRGLLREPIAALQRANLIVLTRSDEVSDATRSEVVRIVQRESGGKPVVQALQRIGGLVDVKGRPVDGVDYGSTQAVIFAGVGNFQSFRRSVERLGVRILAAYEFPDHHYYSAAEIESLASTASSLEANVLLTTEKDSVKLVGRWTEGVVPLMALKLEVEFTGDGDRMVGELIEGVLSRSS